MKDTNCNPGHFCHRVPEGKCLRVADIRSGTLFIYFSLVGRCQWQTFALHFMILQRVGAAVLRQGNLALWSPTPRCTIYNLQLMSELGPVDYSRSQPFNSCVVIMLPPCCLSWRTIYYNAPYTSRFRAMSPVSVGLLWKKYPNDILWQSQRRL